MKTIFITSNLGASKKVNGERIACKMNNSNQVIQQIKDSVKKFDNFVFIVSNPTTFETNYQYANCTFESFKKSGVGFKNLIVVDDKNKQDIEKIIKCADFVFLAGGHVPTQNKFFKEINLKSLLNSYDGVIMGQSAGSMNLAKLVYNYPEDLDELSDPKFLEGLGLTDLTIVPHFNIEKGNEQVDEKIDLMNDYLKKDSKVTTLYCVTNFSHIKIQNGKTEFYGDIYIMKDGEINYIDNNSKQF